MKICRFFSPAVLAFALAAPAIAQTVSVRGQAEVSLKAQAGDLATARKVARQKSESDAISSALRLRLNVNASDPKVAAAIAEMTKQLGGNLKTTFRTEGDSLTALTTLEADSATVFDLAKQLGVGSASAMAAAKVLFVIDEYFGVGTKLDPSAPTSTEITYSHDKTLNVDKSVKASGAESSASSSARSSKESAAMAASEKTAVAASRDTRVSASDKSSVSARERSAAAGGRSDAVAINDGRGGSGAAASSAQIAASRDSQVSGSRDSKFSGSDKQSLAASSDTRIAASQNRESASASASKSASSFAVDQKDKMEQKDVVNYTFKQTFPDLNNAKPEGSSMVVAKLEQVSKNFGLSMVSERDFRVEGGRRLLISDIEKLGKFDEYLKKASKGNFSANYVVYGTGKSHLEGKTSTGNVACSGSIALQSVNVDTGESLISGTVAKRAEGSIDTNCRDNLAQAMASELARIVGEEAAKDLQRAATQGRSYSVNLYSRLDIPARLRRDFRNALQKLANSPDEVIEGNSGEGKTQWTVTAKGQFKSKLEDASLDIADKFPDAAKNMAFEASGTKIYICLEGKCPSQSER